MKGNKDDLLAFKPVVPAPNPEAAPGGLELEKLTARIRLEARKDCLVRIEGRVWYPGEIDEAKDEYGRLVYLIDRDTLIRVLGLGMAR